MEFFSIGQVSRSAGIPISTIRYYESIGLLPPCPQMNGKRMAQAAGYHLMEIQTMLHDFPADTPPSERWNAFADQKINELDAKIAQLQAMKALLLETLNCQCPTLEDCAEGISKEADLQGIPCS